MTTRNLIANASALTFSHISGGIVQHKPISIAAVRDLEESIIRSQS